MKFKDILSEGVCVSYQCIDKLLKDLSREDYVPSKEDRLNIKAAIKELVRTRAQLAKINK